MLNPMSLEGRTVIVTGAAQGIGRAITHTAVGLGANVVAIDMNAEGLAETAAPHGARVTTVAGSVADPALAAQAVDRAVAQYGAVHGLVNNAGIIRPAMIDKMSQKFWADVVDVHLNGSFYFLQAVGRHMIERAKAGDKAPGAIVNISSDAGRRGSVGQINYAAAKSGIFGLTMSAAREWGRYGICTNAVCFGMVETAMTETIRSDKFRDTYMQQIALQRFSSPEEVSVPVCFLLGPGASYITGQVISVNGGYTITM
ncbi:MAG: SDR family NAD(P)-dependent oxidoreductase [Gammaproteobacteria bacterium]